MTKTDHYRPGTFDKLISGSTAIVPYIDELLETTDVEVDNMRDIGEHFTDLSHGNHDFFRGLDNCVRNDYSVLKAVAEKIKPQPQKRLSGPCRISSRYFVRSMPKIRSE